jgi:molecular chaperone HscB
MSSDLGKNFFELFELPVTFDLDSADLLRRYRELQVRVHPDRHAAGTDQERRLAVQMTAMINEAYQTLRDPVRRGRYLLGLQGVDTGEETDTAMAPAFLMDQMELREALEEARETSDPAARLAELGRAVKERIDERIRAVSEALAEDSDAGRQRARNLIRELQFFSRLQGEMEALEESLI